MIFWAARIFSIISSSGPSESGWWAFAISAQFSLGLCVTFPLSSHYLSILEVWFLSLCCFDYFPLVCWILPWWSPPWSVRLVHVNAGIVPLYSSLVFLSHSSLRSDEFRFCQFARACAVFVLWKSRMLRRFPGWLVSGCLLSSWCAPMLHCGFVQCARLEMFLYDSLGHRV